MLASVQSFTLNTRIIFGIEALRELPMEGRGFGEKVLVVTGKNSAMESGSLNRVETLLRGTGVTPVRFSEV